MSECNHQCEGCASADQCEHKIEKAKFNSASSVKKVIGILSGKGGVGKSFVTSLIASSLSKKGYKVGILDADVTGPSIPKSFGIAQQAFGDGQFIYPIETKGGIKIMSSNLLLDNADDPIIWRGPLLGGLVKQFYEDVYWGDLDYLLIDMPPGTADVALTVFQMLPPDELIIVTSPQDLVSLIVSKALKMAQMMNIHLLGVIENMSYVECPHCHKPIYLYGHSHIDDLQKELGFTLLGKMPIDVSAVGLIDEGKAEEIDSKEIDEIVNKYIIEEK